MRLTSRLLCDKTKTLIDHYSQYHPSVLSIQKFIDFGTKNASEKDSFLFLRKELPVRYANIMKEFNLLPEILTNQSSAKLVKKWYEESFMDVVKFEKTSPDEKTLLEFSKALNNVRTRQQTVVETMALSIVEMKEEAKREKGRDSQLDSRVQYFLDRFFMSRISIRMLMNQHLIIFEKVENPSKHIGCIDPSCDILAVAEDAYENARFLCEQYYSSDTPKCDFVCYDAKSEAAGRKAERITMTYVPSHLFHMLMELFKNALRAVVEFHKDVDYLPHLKLLICKGSEDVTIKLSDEGGGIRRSELDLLFRYMYTTAPPPTSAQETHQSAPLAGYGFGLPLSRLYAKYLNGDLWLNSVDGYGTDAMISLKLFPGDASEYLPVFNKTSSQMYKKSTQIGDWSDKP